MQAASHEREPERQEVKAHEKLRGFINIAISMHHTPPQAAEAHQKRPEDWERKEFRPSEFLAAVFGAILASLRRGTPNKQRGGH